MTWSEKEEGDYVVDEAWGDEGVECRPWESLLCDLIQGEGGWGALESSRVTGSAATSRLPLNNPSSGPFSTNVAKLVGFLGPRRSSWDGFRLFLLLQHSLPRIGLFVPESVPWSHFYPI